MANDQSFYLVHGHLYNFPNILSKDGTVAKKLALKPHNVIHIHQGQNFAEILDKWYLLIYQTSLEDFFLLCGAKVH